MKKIITSVLGAGSWGTALAFKASRNSDEVFLVFKDKKNLIEAQNINENKKYIPGVKFSNNIIPVYLDDSYEILQKSNLIILAVPSEHLISSFEKVKNYSTNALILVASKGLNPSNNSFFSEYFKNNNIHASFIVGPNFADEVAKNYNSITLISSKNIDNAIEIAKILRSDSFDVEVNNDIITTQLAGAYKNIIAIYSGYLSVKNNSQNHRAKLCYDAAKELGFVSQKFDGNSSNVFSPLFLDLILSSYSEKSRNFKYGVFLAELEKEFNIEIKRIKNLRCDNTKILKKIEDYQFNHLVEGIKSCIILKNLCKDFFYELKLLNKIVNELYFSEF